MATAPVPRLTEEEYLRIEREAQTKSEFFDGQMFAMSGGSLNHSFIASRLIAIFDRQVSGSCRVSTSDLRIHIPAFKTYTYPDCLILCGEPQLVSDQKDNLLNPMLIVEVLSPSSEAYDRGKKFEMYRSIASLREYLLIHQDRRHVEHYSRQEEDSWLLRECFGSEATVSIARLSVEISLAELYATAVNLD